MTIHFICRGNAYRTIIAEAYLKSLRLKGVEVLSSGTVANMHRTENESVITNIVKRLYGHSIGIYAKTRSEQLTQQRVDDGDNTICMNQIVVDECKNLVSLPRDVIVWDVADTGEGRRIVGPNEDDYQYFEEIYEEVTHNIDELIAKNILTL